MSRKVRSFLDFRPHPPFPRLKSHFGARNLDSRGFLILPGRMNELVEMLIFTIVFLNLGGLARSDAYSHRYKRGDEVPLYGNKVGPFHNPSETYAFSDMPFCPPDDLKKKKESLGEALNGDRLVSAPYKLPFLEDKESQVICRQKLTKEEVMWFKNAISQDYYLQMYYDDLPVWAFIGKVDRKEDEGAVEFRYHLYTHSHFEIFYNQDRVLAVNCRIGQHSTVDVTNEKEIDVEFLYSVKWTKTNGVFEKRMERFWPSSRLPYHLAIHWFSITNSSVMILILIGCLATIYLRVLRRDILKYSQDDESNENQEESGWKGLHGDVFRYPQHKSLFAAALGSGTHLLLVAVSIFILSLVGVFQPYDRGVLLRTLIIIYAITFGISGFTSVSFYRQLEGTNWIRNLVLTGGIFCGPFFFMFCFLNTVAISYGSSAAIPSGAIMVILVLWIFLASPSLLFGGILGKGMGFEFQAPCRTTKCPRDIPPLRWYRSAIIQMALAGFLPFFVMYIELYYVFASVWGHRVYTIYGVLFVVFILLLTVTALVSIALTYFQLVAEDHKWWWRSFLCGGSTGLYIFGYAIYYYMQRSNMKGFMQISFFFGYMACISYGVFLMLGAVGYRASLLFVRHIYSSIKCE
ncbi:PREDICTED: transmembrane 9 superfamily member 3-like isoform X2 [Ipomoea nil]|uniref:transmembrane 9 superfamily member 3-like isoform X2 n=1 Tax=Ipomoea nil TaxID=35883 RepID=UPI000901C7C8|nr:PREDICTED: transmembrane 9 superfamily member 3-like isoform X2 [Ipomoea nil]